MGRVGRCSRWRNGLDHQALRQFISSQKRTLFNTGSVGNCMDDPTPVYVIIEGAFGSVDEAPFSLQSVRVPYDMEAELAAAREMGMPELEEYTGRAAPRHLPRMSLRDGTSGRHRRWRRPSSGTPRRKISPMSPSYPKSTFLTSNRCGLASTIWTEIGSARPSSVSNHRSAR